MQGVSVICCLVSVIGVLFSLRRQFYVSNQDALNLIQAHLIITPVVQASRWACSSVPPTFKEVVMPVVRKL